MLYSSEPTYPYRCSIRITIIQASLPSSIIGLSVSNICKGGADDTAAAKMAIMRECGIHVVDSPAEIGDTMLRVLSGK